MTEFVVISGLSGAGRSSAADDLEDLGWFVIDNLPAPLFGKILELTTGPTASADRVALVIGTAPYQSQVVKAIRDLRATGSRVRVLFLDASTESLVRRYESTRRRHPNPEADTLLEAIEAERDLLEPVKAEADLVVDTTDLNVHQLRRRIHDLFGREAATPGMQLRLVSFGYKHGLPLDADLVFDCRFIPNPHWVDALRPLTGCDAAVRDYVLSHHGTRQFLQQVDELFELLLPAYSAEGKAYLTIAFGCTGGRHRSVAIAEEVARALRRRGENPVVSHRDLDR